jgi:hypothetical protein
MVTLACADARSAFDHSMNAVSGRNDNSNLKRVLKIIVELLFQDDKFIDDMKFKDK